MRITLDVNPDRTISAMRFDEAVPPLPGESPAAMTYGGALDAGAPKLAATAQATAAAAGVEFGAQDGGAAPA